MSITLTIGGANISAYLQPFSLQHETAHTGSPDMLVFEIISVPADALVVNKNAEVIFSVGGTERFKGRVIRKGIKIESKEIIHWNIECKDPSREAEKGELIAEIYENQTVNDIIAALLAGYPQLAAFTMNHVSCTEVIDYLYLDHLRFPEVLKNLADRVGYITYIDKDNDIHLFLPGAEEAPFAASYTNGTMQQDSFSYSEDLAGIANSITMEGGEYDASETDSDSFTATAGQTEFNLSGRYSQVTVTDNGVAKTVGIFALHDPADFDCLHDFAGKRIVFSSGRTVGHTIVVSGKQKLPVIIQIDDTDSVIENDIFGKFEKDASLKTQDSAVQYASALLDKFGSGENMASFLTLQDGLRAGQKIHITNSVIGLDDYFYIQRTRSRLHAGDGNQYMTQVDCAKAEIVDAVGVLARMLNKQNQSSTAEAVLNLYRRFRDTVTETDSLEYGENKSITWVLGPYFNATFSDAKRVPLLNWSSATLL